MPNHLAQLGLEFDKQIKEILGNNYENKTVKFQAFTISDRVLLRGEFTPKQLELISKLTSEFELKRIEIENG